MDFYATAIVEIAVELLFGSRASSRESGACKGDRVCRWWRRRSPHQHEKPPL